MNHNIKCYSCWHSRRVLLIIIILDAFSSWALINFFFLLVLCVASFKFFRVISILRISLLRFWRYQELQDALKVSFSSKFDIFFLQHFCKPAKALEKGFCDMVSLVPKWKGFNTFSQYISPFCESSKWKKLFYEIAFVWLLKCHENSFSQKKKKLKVLFKNLKEVKLFFSSFFFNLKSIIFFNNEILSVPAVC